MTVRLESLRVQADMDASAYVQGAIEKTQADQKMVDSAQAVDTAVQKTERTISQSTSGLDKVRNQLDKSAKAAADYAVAVSRINTAYEKGRITAPGTKDALSGSSAQAERDRLLKLAKERYSPSNQNTFGGKFSYTDAEILRSGAINVVQSLGAGMGVGRTLETQFFQTAPALPALFSAIGGGAIAAASAITAVATALAIVGARAISIQTEMRGLTVALKGAGNDNILSGFELHGDIERMRDAGFSHEDALSAAQSMARGRGVNGHYARQVSDLAPDFSAGSGLNATEATKTLVDLADKGWPAVQQLDEQYRFLTTDQYAHIKALEEQGRKTEAAGLAIDALRAKFKGLSEESKGDLTKSLDGLARSYDNLVDSAANSSWLNAIIKAGSAFAQLEMNGWSFILSGKNAYAPKSKGDIYKDNFTSQSRDFSQNVEDVIAGNKMLSDTDEEAGNKRALFGQSPGLRYLMQTRQDAEREALQQHLSGPQKNAYVEGKTQIAQIEHDGTISDQNTELQKNIQLTQLAAQAYTESAAAGVRADMAKTAALDAWKSGNTDAGHAQQLVNQWVAQATLTGAQSLNTLQQQVNAAHNMAEASGIGAYAERDATVQEKIRQATLQQTIAMELASGEQKEELARQIALVTAKIKEQAQAELEASHKGAMLQGRRDLKNSEGQLDIAKAGANGASDGEMHQMQLQLEQEQKLAELRNKYGSNTDMINSEMGLFTQKQSTDEMTRVFNQIREQSKQVSSEMASSFISGFKESANQGHTIYKNVMAGIVNIAENASEKLAQMLLEKAIFDPIASGLVSNFSSMFGIASSASSSSTSSTSSSTSSGLFSGIFSALGFRAGGGETYAGNAYEVGERGKELFIPRTNGTIVSNSNLARVGIGSVSPNFNFKVTVSGPAASDPKTAAQSGNTLALAMKAQIIQIIQDQQRVGGALAK